MTSTKHMRLSGHSQTFVLTPDAHRKIFDYLAASRRHLSDDPDADETIRDLEASLGERLSVLTTSNGEALGDSEVAAALDTLGDVEPEAAKVFADDAAPHGPFWCRIVDGKWFGGICVGIAARGDFRLDWVRTIAIFLMLLSGGLIGFVYLGLLLFLPRVATVAEYRRLTSAPVAAHSSSS